MIEEFKPELKVEEPTFRERWQRILTGLQAARDSGEYKFAVSELRRIFGSSGAATALTLVLLLVALFIKVQSDASPPSLDTRIVEPEKQQLDKIEEPPKEPEPQPEEVTSMDPGHEQGSDKVEQIVNQAPSFGDGTTDEIVPVQAVDVSTISPMIIKGLYGARTGGGRASAIGRHGGGGSDTVVLRALRWLKSKQLEDGSWPGSGSPTAMCGLALLCYLAHGETPASKEFGETVEKAIRYLLYAMEANGRFKAAGSNYSYGHAIATYALAESYTMTRMTMIKEAMEKGVQVIIDGQQGGGAFNYNYAKAERKDMSVTAWQVQALKAAKIAGAENKGLDECLYKCIDGVKSFHDGQGFGYTGPGTSKTLTGAGILCLQFLDRANDPAAQAGLKATADQVPGWPNEGGGTYGWYYLTQARFQNGGPLWESWNKVMLPMLTKNQIVEGNLGHWESGSTHSASPVYDTALCCLCLEVYYRYLPTYERADEVRAKPKTREEADVKISVDMAL